ncbi:MAG: PKD domain-containing protein [Thermoplasmata archaeon]
MNIKQGGRLDMNDMEVHIEGSICEWSNSFTTIQDSRLHFVEAGEGNFYLYSEGECNLLDSVVYTDEGHSLRVVVQNVANIRDSSFRNLLKGVEVYSDNVEIININIKNSNGAGILVGEGYTPVINGGEISKCQYGILMGAEEMEPLQTSESGIMGAKPTVDVSYSPDTPAPEDGVRFKGECTGVDFDNGDEWNWEFSGPHTVVKDYYDSSLDELVAYVYWTSTGTYEVSLTITRTSDGQTATDETEITVTVSEVEVNFEYTPTSPLTSETVSFSDDSVIPAGWSIVGYEWTIDGGWYSDDSDWDHQFDTPGDYEVELTITIEDDQGNKNDYSKTKTVTVEANKPKAYFSYSIDGLKVYFTDESKPRAGNIESYQWEFGDEDTSTIKNPTHTYDSRGEYVVRLTVENSYGKSDSYTETIAVGKPVAKIFEYKTVGHYEEEDDGMWRMTVELDGSGSMSEWGTIESYKWEFVEHDGDVTVIEGTDKGIVTHTYESPNPVVGFHLPRLTVTDDIGLTHTTSTRVVAYYKSGHTVSNLKVFDNDIGIYITGGTGTQAGAVGERISVSGNYVNLFDCTVCDNTVGIQSEGIHFALKDTYVFNNDVSTRLDGLGGRTFMIPVTGSYDRNPGLLEFENFASEWNPDEDWDGDGLSWTDELWMYGTDPTLLSDLNIDSDGDGITNNDEADVYGTDPLRPDTDRDGVLDGDDLFPFYDALLKLNVRETGEGEENLLTAGEPLAWTVWEDKWYSGLPQRYERTFGFDEHGVTLPRNIPDYRSYIDSYLEFTVWDYQYGARTIFYELRHDVSDGSTTYLDKSNLGLWEPTDNGYVVLYRCDERDIELEMKMFTAPEINPGRQRMLAEQHAPILRFNEGENFFPTHVENFLEQSSLYDGDGMLIKDEVTSQDLVDNSGPENYLALDYDDAVEPYDYNVYSRVATARDDWIVIQYWFFYVYDDKDIVPGTDIEKHEGDWEMIQIELTPYGAPLSVGYSQHYGGELAWWYDIEKEDDSPVVYVAKGSHASYPESGGWQIGGYGEEYKGNGDELHPLDYTITFSDNHPWLQFQGKWGSDSGSVPGPVYRHSKPHDVLPSGPQAYIWIEPVRWQEVSLDIWS